MVTPTIEELKRKKGKHTIELEKKEDISRINQWLKMLNLKAEYNISTRDPEYDELSLVTLKNFAIKGYPKSIETKEKNILNYLKKEKITITYGNKNITITKNINLPIIIIETDVLVVKLPIKFAKALKTHQS